MRLNLKFTRAEQKGFYLSWKQNMVEKFSADNFSFRMLDQQQPQTKQTHSLHCVQEKKVVHDWGFYYTYLLRMIHTNMHLEV